MKEFIRPFVPPIVIAFTKKILGKPRVERHRGAIGGMWDEIGELQFEFLLNRGLKPEHKFLDIGCGSLRGGVHFIRYLNNGNYFGIDKDRWLLDRGRQIELSRYGLENKDAHLVEMDNFDFSSLDTEFDYALAQSVFTHLPWNDIVRCIMNVEKVLGMGGEFYATFFENPKGKFNIDPIHHQPGGITTYFDKDPYHYDFGSFVDICKKTALEVEYIGEWNHPRDQKVMIFRKTLKPNS